MKKLIYFIPIFVFILLWSLFIITCTNAHAETIYTLKDGVLPTPRNVPTGGIKINAVSCSAGGGAPHSTGIMYVERVESLVLTIQFSDPDSTTSYLDVYCQSTDSSLYSGIYADMPVLISTAPTGITTATTSRIRWVSTTGGAPGSTNFTLTYSNLPDREAICYVECGAGYAADDLITLWARGITP